jgi:23S rRNA pseudouridine1911/1915/1917 synthase
VSATRRAAREREWHIEAGTSLAEALDARGVEPAAITEGRVFVDGRRVSDPGARLLAGARLRVGSARDAAPIVVLAREGGLVAVEKPAPIATEPDRAGARGALTTQLAELLGVDAREVHAASRLDVGVSGVVLCAVGREARALMHDRRAASAIERRYVGLAGAAPTPSRGLWSGAVDTPRGKLAAETRYACFATTARGALLGLEPITGRFRQLRAHAAQAGAALYGDVRSGAPRSLTAPDGARVALSRIALHAARVSLVLPDGTRFEALSPPAELAELWAVLGGAPNLVHEAARAPLDG